ncbi:MAG: helix-turn-helix transcriptional regulator [Chitinispirillaceae bacterium]|nr:helix-turn-helix transcriptional regulator [Chitinispirillaceae bacterium]
MNYLRYALFFLLMQYNGFLSMLFAQPCIDFITPVTGSSITVPLCTLLIEKDNCSSSIRKIDFQARYFPAGSDTATIISIGSVSRKPYSILWDLSGIPNQLFTGATLFAEATFTDGDMEAVRREGVFFLHQKVERPVFNVSYEFSGGNKLSGEAIHLTGQRTDVSIDASIRWNEKELIFIAEVGDPHFHLGLPREKLASIGIEILLDPSRSRKPFPGRDVFIYSVPLNGKPYRIMYKPIPDDSGTFKFETSTLACEFGAEIRKTDGQGFTISCPIPITTFCPELPDTIGCNLVVKTLSDRNEVSRSSWIKASLYETYSPYLWGELYMQPKPIFMNRLLVGVFMFGFGFFITLLVSALIMLLCKPSVKSIAKQSDADRQQFVSIKEVFDSNVIERNVTIESVAKALNFTPKQLGTLIRRATGMDFTTYVMYARIEIAKERLRSSHCTEESIAQACGFHSVNEMEKYFVRFHRITPARFRSEQQVV